MQGKSISLEATCLAFGCPMWVEAEKFLHLRFHKGQPCYSYMHLLSFTWKYYPVVHHPKCYGCPPPVDGKHRFPLAEVPSSQYWLPLSPFCWGHDTSPSRYLWYYHQCHWVVEVQVLLVYLQSQDLSFTKGVTCAIKDVIWLYRTTWYIF